MPLNQSAIFYEGRRRIAFQMIKDNQLPKEYHYDHLPHDDASTSTKYEIIIICSFEAQLAPLAIRNFSIAAALFIMISMLKPWIALFRGLPIQWV